MSLSIFFNRCAIRVPASPPVRTVSHSILREEASKIAKEKLGIDKPLSGEIRVTCFPRPGEQFICEEKHEAYEKEPSTRNATPEEIRKLGRILEKAGSDW